MTEGSLRSRGAYGFRLEFGDSHEDLSDLVDLDPTAPLVTVNWRHASTTKNIQEVTESSVIYGARQGATFSVQRDPASVVIDLPAPPAPGALVHPILTVGISVLARWRGFVTLHAGAFEAFDGAWAVMGSREAGKSTMLAELAVRGNPVVADDLVVLDRDEAWAGPNCVDLREDAARRFPEARDLGIVGGRHRFRLSTASSRPRLPLRGIFVLDWQRDRPEVGIASHDIRERLRWLYKQEYISLVGPPEPARLLPLLGIPAWRVVRPADWRAADEVVERMLSVAEERATTAPRA